MRHSKEWKTKCDPYLRKRILPGPTIRNNLNRWIVTWEGYQDDEGRSVFGRDTKKATMEQLKKVALASDPPNEDMYKKIPPPPKSKHHLPKWQSLRPEAALEKTHEFLAHLVNTGTNSELADIIIMGGIAEFNVQCRFKDMTNSCRLQGQKQTTPAHFEDLPPFSNHSLLSFINSKVRRCGLPDLFLNVTPINPDNGEVFLAKYFEEQMISNYPFQQSHHQLS